MADRTIIAVGVIITLLALISFLLIWRRQSTVAGRTTLVSGDSLLKGEFLVSPDSVAVLKMESDGNLVLRNATGDAIWATNTSNSGADHLAVGGSGELALVGLSGSVLWSAKASKTNDGPYQLMVTRDAKILLISKTGETVWQT